MLTRRIEGKHALDPFSMEIFEKTFTIGVFFISAMLVLQIWMCFSCQSVPMVYKVAFGQAVDVRT